MGLEGLWDFRVYGVLGIRVLVVFGGLWFHVAAD